MDRTLKLYAPTGHLFAEFAFFYDKPGQAKLNCVQYRPLLNDDGENENMSVYRAYEQNVLLKYREFASIEEIKTYDRQVVKKELGRDKEVLDSFTYVYEEQPVLVRYLVANAAGCMGMVNVFSSFINNTKEVKFLSAADPEFDVDISSNSLETNLSCILRIDVLRYREEPTAINPNDLTRLNRWY